MIAIPYIRISEKDQSNFSLEGQEFLIKDFCSKQGWELSEAFIDNGRSAKSFDRPDWRRLESFVKTQKVDYLVVAKYDRFSRNLVEALQMIEKFEKEHKITIVSVMENIGLHPKSPYFFKMRADILVNAQTEWLTIRDRIRFGLHTAHKAGRYVNCAPIGYVNARDEKNKPILQIDPVKSEIIKVIFSQFLNGQQMHSIAKDVKEMGFKQRGRSAIKNILENVTYAGLIKVSKYYDEEEKLVKGIHEPIISESDFYKVQAKLNYKGQRAVLNNDVPLRGKLLCHCGKHLTAGNSKGKFRYYWYYRCEVHRENLSAVKLHSQLEEILKELSLSEKLINAVKSGLAKQAELRDKDKNERSEHARKDLFKVNQDLDSLEYKYINNKFEHSSYLKWKALFMIRQNELTKEINFTKTQVDAGAIDRMSDFNMLYKKATTEQKQNLIGWVFKNRLYYQNGSYRTPEIQDFFKHKEVELNKKGLLIFEKADAKIIDFAVSTQEETSLEHLINIINSIKAA